MLKLETIGLNVEAGPSWLGLPVLINPRLAADEIVWHKDEPQFVEAGSMDAVKLLIEKANKVA